MTNNDFYWYWFTNIAGIGVKTQKKLLEHFGHPSTIYNAPESEIKGILTTGQCKEVIASKNQKKIEASIRKLEKREIYFFHRESQEYPERLAQLYEPPNLLYYTSEFFKANSCDCRCEKGNYIWKKNGERICKKPSRMWHSDCEWHGGRSGCCGA